MASKICILILILSVTCYGDDNDLRCPNKALRKCLCGHVVYDYIRQYVVNCTNTNFRSTDVLENLPSETQVLIFTGNHIPELPWNVFGPIAKLTELRTIDMSNNGIKDIPGKAYHHVENVELLILNHNELSISDDSHHPRVFSNFINLLELHLTNAFEDDTDEALSNDLHDIFVNSNLTRLKKLHLEQNEIQYFRDRQIFCELPALMDLHLSNNFLKEINFNITCLKHLRFLDLEYNKFNVLTDYEFRMLDHIASTPRAEPLVMDISGNPLICSEARNLVNWINQTKVMVRRKEALTCSQNTKDNPILLLKKFLQMSASVTDSTNPLAVIILTLLILTLVCALLYAYWDKILVKSKPLYNTLHRKVHYTTIEAQVDHV